MFLKCRFASTTESGEVQLRAIKIVQAAQFDIMLIIRFNLLIYNSFNIYHRVTLCSI